MRFLTTCQAIMEGDVLFDHQFPALTSDSQNALPGGIPPRALIS